MKARIYSKTNFRELGNISTRNALKVGLLYGKQEDGEVVEIFSGKRIVDRALWSSEAKEYYRARI